MHRATPVAETFEREVFQVDVPATALTYLGVPLPETFDGRAIGLKPDDR